LAVSVESDCIKKGKGKRGKGKGKRGKGKGFINKAVDV
jgi:hypothetical protein